MSVKKDSKHVAKLRAESKMKTHLFDCHCQECKQETSHYIFTNPSPIWAGGGTAYHCYECDTIPSLGAVVRAYNRRMAMAYV